MLAGLVTATGAAPPAAAGISPGQTLLVSMRGDNTIAQDSSASPAVSGDGRWVVLTSLDALDTAAVEDDVPSWQIYVRDLQNNTTRLLSFTYTGEGDDTKAVPAAGTSDLPAISASGRYVAFQTNAPLAGAGDVHKVILVDRDPDGDGTLDEPIGSTIQVTFTLLSDPARPAFAPSVSADGLSTVFEHLPTATTTQVVIARATPADAPGTYTVARQALLPQLSGQVLEDAWTPAISGDGTRVVAQAAYHAAPVFETLLAPAPTAPAAAMAPPAPAALAPAAAAPAPAALAPAAAAPAPAALAPAAAAPAPAALAPAAAAAPAPATSPNSTSAGFLEAGSPVVSSSATVAGWAAAATVPAATVPAATVPAAAGAAQAPPRYEAVVGFDVAAVDPGNNVPAVRLDVQPGGAPIGAHLGGNRPLISGDGTKVVFEVSVEPCDSCEFPTEPRAYLAKVDTDGNGAIGPITVDTLSRDNAGDPIRAIMPAISGDGRYAAFVTDAFDAHNGVDIPGGNVNCATPRGGTIEFAAQEFIPLTCQIVVRDLVLDQTRLVDEQPRLPGELASPSLLAECTDPDPLPPGETCASAGRSQWPSLSTTGGVVAYITDAADLVAGDDNDETDVFARRFTPGVQAAAVDFGGVQVGDTVSSGVAITPVGFGPLVVGSVTVAGTGFTAGLDTCVGVVLHVESSCAATVEFAPKAEGTHTGTLLVAPSFVPGVPVAVTGIGTAFPQPDPAFQAQPDPLDFGERLIFTDSAAGVVTVLNAGTRRMTIDAVSLPPLAAPGAPADYRITANTCVLATLAPVTLAPGTSCTVTLVHQPRGPGARPAVLQIDQRVPTEPPGVQPHLVQLLGAGTTPSIQVNPGVVPVGRPTVVIGVGFPPGRPVSIRMPGFPELATVTPDAAGAFTGELLVFPNSVAGQRVLNATVDIDPTIGGTTTLLVVPGSIGPPDFLVRR